MLNILIIISKYLFILYISLFLLHGFIAGTNKNDPKKYGRSLGHMRAQILLFHINAYLILLLANTDSLEATFKHGFGILVFLVISALAVRKLYPNSSQLLWNGVFFLCDIGLITLQSLNPSLAEKQLVWHISGFIIALVLPAVLNRAPRLDKFKNAYIITAIVLLISTLIFGSEEFGSRNWISLGPLSFQPSEVVKILFTAYLASAFSKNPEPKQILVPSVLCMIVLMCFVGQKDLGSALIFFMSFMVVLYIATSNIMYFLGGMGLAGFGAFIAYHAFSHIRVRVAAWLDPWSDVANTGYQIAHSLFAIATYGLTGIGFTRGYSTSIPVVERDFIFSAICEEFGVIFGIGVILIFLMIFMEGAVGALNAQNRFLCLFCAGTTALLAFQSFVILGGVTKLIPLTGVTLPFISYGGTSVLVCYVLIAIIQWIYQSCVQYDTAAAAEEAHEPRPRRRRRTEDDDIHLDEVLQYNKRRRGER